MSEEGGTSVLLLEQGFDRVMKHYNTFLKEKKREK